MRNTIARGFAAATLLVGCNGSDNTESVMLERAEASVSEFSTLYDCLVPIEITIESIDIGSEVLSPDRPSLVAGTATRGEVIIDPVAEEIDQVYEGFIEHVAWHEASHACSADRVSFDTPYDIVNAGIQMIGNEGLVAIGTAEQSDEEINFTLVDEGLAELLAYSATGFEQEGSGHVSARLTTEKYLTQRDITLQEAQDFQESGDLIGLIARFVGKPAETITAEDISGVFNEYLENLMSS